MLTASFRRAAFLVPLVAVLATPQISAAGFPDLMDRVWSVLRPYLKEGCKLDPNGSCSNSTARPTHTKEGCKIDPDGRCYTSAKSLPIKAGCKLDPNGLCLQ